MEATQTRCSACTECRFRRKGSIPYSTSFCLVCSRCWQPFPVCSMCVPSYARKAQIYVCPTHRDVSADERTRLGWPDATFPYLPADKLASSSAAAM